MGKVLIIKNANFYNNKVKTVVFDDVPCTGISLSESSITITGETTITATVTPSDTTDAIIWTSSNTNVVTVNNGVVTFVSSGTATVTATCGSYSDSCEVTAVIPLEVSKAGIIRADVNNAGTALYQHAIKTTGTKFITFGTNANAADGYPVLGFDSGTDMFSIYPYPIPTGAKTITINAGDKFAPLIVYYDRHSKAHSSDCYVRDIAKVLDGQTTEAGTPWSIDAWVYGPKTYTIPDISGINSFTIGFNSKTVADYNNFDVDNPGITVTFGFE